MLKPFEQVLESDRRYQAMVLIDRATGATRQFALEDHYASIAGLELGELVPQDIGEQFDNARNVFIYGWFDYNLIAVSDGLAYGALELALKTRANKEGIKFSRPAGLRKLLEIALNRQWLRDDRFPSFVKRHGYSELSTADPQAFCRILLETLPELRNEFAHGNFSVYPPGSALIGLELCAEIIVQLFSEVP